MVAVTPSRQSGMVTSGITLGIWNSGPAGASVRQREEDGGVSLAVRSELTRSGVLEQPTYILEERPFQELSREHGRSVTVLRERRASRCTHCCDQGGLADRLCGAGQTGDQAAVSAMRTQTGLIGGMDSPSPTRRTLTSLRMGKKGYAGRSWSERVSSALARTVRDVSSARTDAGDSQTARRRSGDGSRVDTEGGERI